MRPLICDMCSSNNMVKQDGLFVCQSCGTKYSVDEAKRMMFDGPIEIEGIIKIDRSEDFDNLSQLAQSSMKDKLFKDALYYSKEALEIKPDDIDMIAIKAFARFAEESFNDEIPIYCKNAMKRVNSLYFEFDGSFEERRLLLNRLNNIVRVATTYRIDLYDAAIQHLRNQRREYSARLEKEARTELVLADNATARRRAESKLNKLLKNKDYNEELEYKIQYVKENRSLISEYREQLIRSITIKQKRNYANEALYKKEICDAYWAEHEEEKALIEAEINEYNSKIRELQNEFTRLQQRINELNEIINLGNTPLAIKKKEYSTRLMDLYNRKRRLSIFSGFKRRRIKKEIKELQKNIPSLNAVIEEQKQLKNQYYAEYRDLKAAVSDISSQKSDFNSKVTLLKKELARELSAEA